MFLVFTEHDLSHFWDNVYLLKYYPVKLGNKIDKWIYPNLSIESTSKLF